MIENMRRCFPQKIRPIFYPNLLYSSAASCLTCKRCTKRLKLTGVQFAVHAHEYSTAISPVPVISSTEPVPDWNYILDTKNKQIIKANIAARKGIGDIEKVISLFELYSKRGDDNLDQLRSKLIRAALLIPNRTSPNSPIGSEYEVIKMHGSQKEFSFPIRSFKSLAESLGLLRFNTPLTSNLVYGVRSYFLVGDLARLERALVHWTIGRLQTKGWQYVTVPDLLPESLINGCGFITTGKQNQIYKVKEDQGNLCLAGTSEMSMAGLYAGKSMPSNEPVKLCTYSPCYRAEEAKNKIDKDFYRLHQFTKVEMFGICNPGDSEALLNEVVSTQQELFSELGLHYRVLEMPTEELGSPAYRKFDVEAWMHEKKHWGEISSASNCTDYQARRLRITASDGESYAHTVNGTACAVPRMLISIIEQNQTKNGKVAVPECLQPLMKTSYLRSEKLSSEWIYSRPYKILK